MGGGVGGICMEIYQIKYKEVTKQIKSEVDKGTDKTSFF